MAEQPTSAFVSLRPLQLTGRRAVGGPVARPLLAAYFASSLVAWLAATVAAVFAAGDLAAGRPLATAPVLAVHLLALGALPLAVSGASFHLLPVMLRNDLPSQRALWLALPLLWGGLLAASGIGSHADARVWVGAGAVSVGLLIVLVELAMLVLRAPSDRTLITSRVGIALSCVHVVAALVLGGLIFGHDRPFAGVAYGRWLLIHLHVALVGWIAVLVLTVGRNLAPMLARAPAAPPRRLPLNELALVLGLWLLLAGLAGGSRTITLLGGAAMAAAAGRFAALIVRTLLRRRGQLEAPLAHLAIGGCFLVQAVGVGVAAAIEPGHVRVVSAYVVFLLVGWAAGVVFGHVGKLLSLSLWVWWPAGPRPTQAALYPRRLHLGEAGAFLIGVEALALGVLAGSAGVARGGAALLALSALLTIGGAVTTWRRRSESSG